MEMPRGEPDVRNFGARASAILGRVSAGDHLQSVAPDERCKLAVLWCPDNAQDLVGKRG